MIDEQLAAIRARCTNATPGPWRYERNEDSYPGAGFFVERVGDDDGVWDDFIVTAGDSRTIAEESGVDWEAENEKFGLRGNPGFGVMKLRDADFIAHAREDIPALLAEIERLRGLLLFAGLAS